jgi:hypothetical protein
MFLTPEYALVAASVLVLIIVYAMAWTEGFENDADGDKATCRGNAKKSLWKQYDFRQRKLNNGKWKCDQGWEDTACNWGMGKEFETKQCRRKRSDAAKYEEAAKTGTMTSELSTSDNARKGRSRCRKYRDGKTVDPPMTEADIDWCWKNFGGFKAPETTAPAATQAPQSGTVVEKPGSSCASNSECTAPRVCSTAGWCTDPDTTPSYLRYSR